MPIIDLSFQLIGSTIPLDHGYALFSALNRVVPRLHGDKQVGVHPIRGRQSAKGVLALIDGSRLRLRLPSEEIAPYIAVAGQLLNLEGHHMRAGIPRVEGLTPAANLAARLAARQRQASVQQGRQAAAANGGSYQRKHARRSLMLRRPGGPN